MGIETVLVAVGADTGEHVEEIIEATLDVAVPAGADVVLVHVFSKDEFDETVEAMGIADPNDVTPNEVARRHETIRDIGEALDEERIEYRIHGSVGDPGEKVAAFARENGADRIITGGRRRSPAGKAIFGSTAQAILLAAPCPVTVVLKD